MGADPVRQANLVDAAALSGGLRVTALGCKGGVENGDAGGFFGATSARAAPDGALALVFVHEAGVAVAIAALWSALVGIFARVTDFWSAGAKAESKREAERHDQGREGGASWQLGAKTSPSKGAIWGG